MPCRPLTFSARTKNQEKSRYFVLLPEPLFPDPPLPDPPFFPPPLLLPEPEESSAPAPADLLPPEGLPADEASTGVTLTRIEAYVTPGRAFCARTCKG